MIVAIDFNTPSCSMFIENIKQKLSKLKHDICDLPHLLYTIIKFDLKILILIFYDRNMI
jgi:hypothetical protein